eukprot:1198347-Rhodomonas_salina.1
MTYASSLSVCPMLSACDVLYAICPRGSTVLLPAPMPEATAYVVVPCGCLRCLPHTSYLYALPVCPTIMSYGMPYAFALCL